MMGFFLTETVKKMGYGGRKQVEKARFFGYADIVIP
jgi:hypothetical protein